MPFKSREQQAAVMALYRLYHAKGAATPKRNEIKSRKLQKQDLHAMGHMRDIVFENLAREADERGGYPGTLKNTELDILSERYKAPKHINELVQLIQETGIGHTFVPHLLEYHTHYGLIDKNTSRRLRQRYLRAAKGFGYLK